MKKSLLLGLGTIALALGGAAFGLHAANVVETKATGVSGAITIDCTGGDWSTNADGQKFSIKFSDGVNEGWGSFISSVQYEYLVSVPYELTFTPTKMTAYRYNPAKTADDWASNKTTSVWNTSSELDFTANSNIIIGAWDTDHNSANVGYWGIAGKSAETSWAWTEPLAMFTGAKLNGSKHVEYYGNFTFSQYAEFLIHEGSTYYKWSAASFSDYVDDSKWAATDNSDKNIQYNGASAITVSIYFDRNAGSIYITDPLYAAADEWAQTFLAGGCTETKANWTALSGTYAALDADVKAIFVGVAADGDEDGAYYEHAVARYDLVLRRYGVYDSVKNPTGYADFMGRAAKLSLAKTAVSAMSTNNNSGAVWAVVIGSVSVAALLGAGFFFRKRRHN